MYACVVRNAEDTWDVWRVLPGFPPNAGGRQERIDDAFASGLPITGMDLTPFGASATSGAVWNGTGLSGGVPNSAPVDTDWSAITMYGYLCNNIVLVIFLSDPFAISNDQMSAIFSHETTMVNIPNNVSVKIGDIWDGTSFISV